MSGCGYGHAYGADYSSACFLCVASRAEQAEAEVARLRDVLEQIADGSCYDTPHDIRQIARGGLATTSAKSGGEK